MRYQIDYTKFSSVFAVPSLSEQLLCTASREALQVLLYLMQHQQQPVDPGYLANRLMIPQEKVLQALDYWVEQGFLSGQGQTQPARTAQQPEVQFVRQPEPQPETRAEPSPQSRVQVGLQAQRRTMSIDEIHTLSQNDASISQLVEAVQAQMGKVLTRSEIETLVSFYTYAGLPPEYILLAAAHCCAKNMPNMRALSKLLTDMMSENIYTYEQAEQYLSRRQQQESAQGQVRSAFGIHDRALSRQECKYIDTWFLDYHFDIAMVKLAYERAIDQIGKVSFPYINKILSSWHEKGITTTQQAAQERQGAKAMRKGEQSSIDFDEIQQYITYGGQAPGRTSHNRN